MIRGATIAFAGAILLAAEGPKGDPYPPGESTHTLEDHEFDIRIPEGAAPERKFSLLLAIDTQFNELGDTAALVKDGWVICIPHAKSKGRGGWATSEASDLVKLLDQLAPLVPFARDRIHVLRSQDSHGFASFVAFEKGSQAVSFCQVNTYGFKGRMPPESARKKVAALSLWSDPPGKYGDGSDIVEKLAGKVRTVEHRTESTAEPYFRYWLSVADDRFRPGWDLSFDWLYDAEPKGKPKPGEKPASVPAPAMERGKAAAASGKRGALIYFWSATDAAKPEAKALQNDLFFRPEVRALGGRLVPIKIEREKAEKEFAAFGLKATPALVVTDAAFAPVKTFEGAVDAKALLDAMKKVAAPEEKGK
jgi:hypothetical protein